MNFEKICRTCSSEGELKSLFKEDSMFIVNMLAAVVDLKVIIFFTYISNFLIIFRVVFKVRENDNYPQSICNQCLEKLILAYEFKKHCLDVQIKFEQCLETHVKQEIYVTEQQYFIIKDENDLNWDNDEKLLSDPIVDSEKLFSEPMTYSEKLLHEPTVDLEKLNINTPSPEKKERKKKKLYTCNICKKKVTQLDRHLRSHTKERPYKCEICNKQFSTKGN